MRPFGDYSDEEKQAVIELLRAQKTGVALAAAYSLEGSASVQIEMGVHQSSCGDSMTLNPLYTDETHGWMYGVPLGAFGFDPDAGQRFLITCKEIPRNKQVKHPVNPWWRDRQKGYCRRYLGAKWGVNKYNGARELFIDEERAWGRITVQAGPRVAALHGGKAKYTVDVYDPNEGGWGHITIWDEHKYGRTHKLVLRTTANTLKEAAQIIFETRYPHASRYLAAVKRERKKPAA